MTIDEALAYGRSKLTHSPTPALDARLLLQFLLDKEHTYLIAHGDESLTAVQVDQYRTLIHRAARHEPIPYITGAAPFYGLDLHVTPAVLIPRPETEQLVEQAIAWANSDPSLHIVDVGTGSGCIPIALAQHLPQARIDAVDTSADALAVARQNAQRHAPGRIQFRQGHLLTPISGTPDLITANLPYVTDAEWTLLDDAVKLHEPSIALQGGVDGLALIRELLQQAVTKLSATGAIFLEIGWQQGPAAKTLAASFFPTAAVHVAEDYAGHDRLVIIDHRKRA